MNLASLHSIQMKVERLIHATPTGEDRNTLTDINIKLKGLIQKQSAKVKPKRDIVQFFKDDEPGVMRKPCSYCGRNHMNYACDAQLESIKQTEDDVMEQERDKGFPDDEHINREIERDL